MDIEPPSWNSLVQLAYHVHPEFRITILRWRSIRRRASTASPTRTIEHAMRHALAIDDQADDTRLHLGPARSADLLEVLTIMRDNGSELVIHAMRMRPKYRRLLPEG